MQQSNASGFNINDLGGAKEFKANVLSILSNVLNTGEVVEITEVYSNDNGPVGFVSVKPILYRIGADNNNLELGEIHNVPYYRIQGGKNAVICDPQVGDIGFCVFATRDTSLLKRTRSRVGPNSKRICDQSDAFLTMTWSKEEAEQYIWFKGDEIHIKANSKIVLDAPEVSITRKINSIRHN
ncbi:baseplate spike [Acinetobacter phage VB_AB_Acb75]